MTTGIVKEKNLEKQIQKQMGCMAGFLQMFDRHQILTGKRFYSAKRLPPPPVVDSASESEKSAPPSPANSIDLENLMLPQRAAAPSQQRPKHTPEAEMRSPAPPTPPKSPLPLPIFEMKDGAKSSWRFCKEAPRLSLDSRATTDAKGSLHPKEIRTANPILSMANRGDNCAIDTADGGQHHRSPSVIARLMGLEPLPSSSGSESEKQPELRRSASESRVSKDLFQSRFVADGSNFYPKQPTQSNFNNAMKDNAPMDAQYADPRNYSLKNGGKTEGSNRGCRNSTSPWRAHHHRKSFFDSGDVFPEPKQTVTIYGEIEKRIKTRGINEPSKDLETLKQILEALQLKGLLHSKQPSPQNQVRHRNFVYDKSPIVLMKPSRSSSPTPINRRMGNDYSNGRNHVRGGRRNYSVAGETPPSMSPRREPKAQSPTRTGRSPSPTTRSNSMVKPKPLSVETQRRVNEPIENRKASPVHSPKLNSKRTGPDPTVSNRLTRSKKPTSEIIRNDVVAEDESSSISGSNQNGDLEEEIWSPLISPIRSKHIEISDDSDFVYISDILRATQYLPEDSDVFLLLEKQQYLKGHDTSKVARLQRKLIFDTINEIIDRNGRLPPWKATGNITMLPSLDKVWSEFQRIRERDDSEDLFETICSVLKKDLADDVITGWGDCPVEMSEAVLDIERLIFKDLICNSIGDLSALACRDTLSSMVPRRKLGRHGVSVITRGAQAYLCVGIGLVDGALAKAMLNLLNKCITRHKAPQSRGILAHR
ncbi:hypothetical protein DH2020_046190 [Rehmannia glutinosa]|uniref:Uncharacterized protein n=1 Tax=Rehmannia glutinosa TaxID=99300 RepID=A0ABR0UCY1_REHGL